MIAPMDTIIRKYFKHKPHHQAHEDKKMGSDISWVHFLEVPKKMYSDLQIQNPCILIPNEQSSWRHYLFDT